jgi:myo-inositol-1(or 4)-monophosphatase
VRAETTAALSAVDLALDLIRRRVGAAVITSKGGNDLATATDLASEALIRSPLLDRFPGWPVIGEERGGEVPPDGGPYWLVDPICGTRNFASDLPLYCVNIALVEDGRVTAAVVGDGGSGRRYIAERGEGAWRLDGENRLPCQTSLTSVTVSLDDGSGSAEAGARLAEITGTLIRSRRWYVRMLGSSLSFALVADGRLAAHVSGRTSGPVHVAAGFLLADEAGATITDHSGQPWTVDTRSFVVAATVELNQELRALL